MSVLLMPSRHESLLLVLDLQDGALQALPHSAEVVHHARVLAEGAAILGIPMAYSELEPARRGGLAEPLRRCLQGAPGFARAHFNALSDPALANHLVAEGRSTLILSGIEAHVAVQQTALGALAMGYRVIVARDATASRRADHAELAEARLSRAGAILEPVEAILYELCERAGTEEHARIERLLSR